MSDSFKVCLYAEASATPRFHLESLLPGEGPCCEWVDSAALAALPGSAAIVLVIEAAGLRSLDQGDGLEAALQKLARVPLVILYEEADAPELEALLGREGPSIDLQLLPRSGLDPRVFLHTLRQAIKKKESERALTAHLRRHEALLELGRMASHDQPLSRIFERAHQIVAEVLGVASAQVLEFDWDPAARSDHERETLALPGPPSEALPLSLEAATSCEAPSLGVSVIISSPEDQRPLGILGAYSQTPRSFTSHDAEFLTTVGHILGSSILRHRLKNQLRQTLDEAKKSSEILEQMMLSIHDYAIFMIDPAGTVINWNTGAAKIMGFAREEVVGRHRSSLPLASGGDGLSLDAVLAIARERGRYEAEGSLKRKDGSALLAATTIVPVYNARHQLQGYTEMVRDVTQERQSQERLNLAFDGAQMCSWEWDIQRGQVSWITGSAHERMEEVMTQSEFKNLVYPDDLPQLEAIVAGALVNGRDFELEFRLREPDGSLRWHVAKGRVFYEAPRQPARLAGIAMDISEKKQSEKELELAKEAAERANEAKSVFLANMSHEIRTPLNAILGFAELIEDSRLSPEKQRDFIRTITRNGKLLSQLLDDILDLSKVEACRLEVEHIRCSLPDIVSDVLKLIGKQASDKGIYLRLTSGYGLPETFISDPSRLKQILINIIGNAVKFTQNGGVHVNVNLKQTGLGRAPQIVFSVMDTGPGIDSQQQQRLFKAFSQADVSISRNFGGTGLGLILARRLAELLGGTVELVYSKPQLGSTFRIAIEAPEPRGACHLAADNEGGRAGSTVSLPIPAAVAPEANDQLLAGISVLIVEDAPDSRALAAQILGQYGAQIALAENGLEAVEVLTSRKFDVVLMDLQMPQLDGFAATAQLRARGYRGPILAVSAAAMKDEKDRALEVGCNDHLTKPFSMGILLDKILGYAHRGRERPCVPFTTVTAAASTPSSSSSSPPLSLSPLAGQQRALVP